jgi:flagellar biosynthetic protein FliR
MTSASLSGWVLSCLLLGLRIAPVFAFAPPFTLVRTPRLFRVLLGIGLSTWLASGNPAAATLASSSAGALVVIAARELAMGTMFVLAFQLAFAALYFVGRTIDIQAGFGLASLIDPTTRGQVPLVGMIFAYVAGSAFFAMDGHLALLGIFAASLDAVPLGQWTMPQTIVPVVAFMSGVFVTALGVAAAPIVALFLIDAVIALLSRTVPQMNVLVLGFQVKTIALLAVLPISFGVGGALLVRMMAMTLRALPELV